MEKKPLIFGVDYAPGWCGFTNTGGAVADGIAYGERWERGANKYPAVTHAFICTGENEGIEAHLETGVARFDLRKYSMDKNCGLYFRQPRGWTPELGARIVATASQTPPFGCPYDLSLITAQALSDTLTGHWLNAITNGRFKRFLCNHLSKPGTFICSETDATVLQKQPELAKLGCLVNPADTIDPQQLFEDDAIFELMISGLPS